MNRNPSSSKQQNNGLDARNISCFLNMMTSNSTRHVQSIPVAVKPNMIWEVRLEKSGLSALLGGISAGGYYLETQCYKTTNRDAVR